MAVRNIIAAGIGFSPGSVKFIVTRGMGASAVATALTSSGKKKGRPITYRHMRYDPDPVKHVITRRENRELARRIRSAIEAEDQQQAAYLNALFAQDLGIAQLANAQAIARQQYLQDSARLAQHRQAIEADDMQVIAQAIQSIVNDENAAISELAYTLVSTE